MSFFIEPSAAIIGPLGVARALDANGRVTHECPLVVNVPSEYGDEAYVNTPPYCLDDATRAQVELSSVCVDDQCEALRFELSAAQLEEMKPWPND
jgi:hypothetical protein